MIKHMGLAAAAAMLLSACGGQMPVDRCASASNPEECRAWTDAGGDIEDYLSPGLVGAGLGAGAAYLLMKNAQGQSYFAPNPSYYGPPRHLRRQLHSQDRQIANLQRKVARQKVELRRQQDANRRYKAEKRKSGGFFSSPSSSRSKSSWGSSSSRRSSRRK